MPPSKDIVARTLGSPQGTQGYAVVEKLLDAGYEAWWVGGCVRDMCREIIPDDIDIATDAHPHDIAKVFPKCDETSADLGAVVVSLKGETFEITTFRKDHPISDSRHPESVTFTDRKSDAERRDITINAMYWNPISSQLFDPFDGEKDLNEKLIRFIGDPDVRIEHDALRLLRVVRFRALIDGQYHPDTFNALHGKSKLIKALSGSRCFRELEKILMGPNPQIAFEDLWETDVIEYLLPELHACKGVAQPSEYHKEGDVWNHTMKLISSFTADHGSDARFAGVFHDIGKPVTFSIEEDRIHFNEHAKVGAGIVKKILDRLQCPATRRDKIAWIVEHHMMMSNFLSMNDVRKAHWYYHPWFIELLQVFWLDIAGSDPSDFSLYDKIIDDYNKYLDANPRPQKPLLNGEEVMEILGIGPGEEIGKALKSLHDAQVRNEISGKKEAMDFLKTHSGGPGGI